MIPSLTFHLRLSPGWRHGDEPGRCARRCTSWSRQWGVVLLDDRRDQGMDEHPIDRRDVDEGIDRLIVCFHLSPIIAVTCNLYSTRPSCTKPQSDTIRWGFGWSGLPTDCNFSDKESVWYRVYPQVYVNEGCSLEQGWNQKHDELPGRSACVTDYVILLDTV